MGSFREIQNFHFERSGEKRYECISSQKFFLPTPPQNWAKLRREQLQRFNWHKGVRIYWQRGAWYTKRPSTNDCSEWVWVFAYWTTLLFHRERGTRCRFYRWLQQPRRERRRIGLIWGDLLSWGRVRETPCLEPPCERERSPPGQTQQGRGLALLFQWWTVPTSVYRKLCRSQTESANRESSALCQHNTIKVHISQDAR